MREAVTWIPSFGAYLKGVKRAEDITASSITVICGKRRLVIAGENLVVEKYYGQDLFIRGDVKGISYD